ncbi:C2H2-type domain-containing protein [Fusarium keratoplasticum]|uniref:C2H2-type domain-containing protein n=1 Tax=Fusarium keratoplasticum TaxID=1328300 RepID=A0ACC0RCL6_9HYPO|nr:C2H2-type domain-containing protein [Fusarium keratoplasticum]KAI8680468.1 C2H2-type domain-containing protein [Fusarium keratoplasticum]
MDNFDGDILEFSKLDFAELGFMLDPMDHDTATEDSSLDTGHQLCREDQSVRPCDTILSAQPLEYTRPTISDFLQFPGVIDLDAYIDPSLSLQAQSSPAEQNHPRQLSTGGIPTPESPSQHIDAYQFVLVPENQKPSLPRRRSRYLRNPAQQAGLGLIPIPVRALADDAAAPMQRWRKSPPETEGASMAAIADVMRHPLRPQSSAGSLNGRRRGTSGSSNSTVSATSTSFRHTTSGRVKKWRRPAPPSWKPAEERRFQCTFCCDSFKSKYDWSRHEKSLHLNLQGWRCAPFGGTVMSPVTGRNHCAYCHLADPAPSHLEMHAHGSCQTQTYMYTRKDQLVQHLRRVHRVHDVPMINSWKVEMPPVSSRCGFCNAQMHNWSERVDHVAEHFRKGKTMKGWKREHGFKPEITARVMDAIPPYLIKDELETFTPFSATDRKTSQHIEKLQISSDRSMREWGMIEGSPESGSNAEGSSSSFTNEDLKSMTFSELLAFHLGHFAQHQVRLGIMPTDSMFQDEARRMQYGTTDPWECTMADNQDWLKTFRSHHVEGLLETEHFMRGCRKRKGDDEHL